MDLLVIPILLTIGGGLVYLGINGMPRVSQLPFNLKRQPFLLTDWLKTRPAPRSLHKAPGPEQDAELVELMNEMIAVREELSGLKLAMGGSKAGRRRTIRKPLKAQPVMQSTLSRPVKQAAKPVAEKQAAQRRQEFHGSNRRYVRT